MSVAIMSRSWNKLQKCVRVKMLVQGPIRPTYGRWGTSTYLHSLPVLGEAIFPSSIVYCLSPNLEELWRRVECVPSKLTLLSCSFGFTQFPCRYAVHARDAPASRRTGKQTFRVCISKMSFIYARRLSVLPWLFDWPLRSPDFIPTDIHVLDQMKTGK